MWCNHLFGQWAASARIMAWCEASVFRVETGVLRVSPSSLHCLATAMACSFSWVKGIRAGRNQHSSRLLALVRSWNNPAGTAGREPSASTMDCTLECSGAFSSRACHLWQCGLCRTCLRKRTSLAHQRDPAMIVRCAKRRGERGVGGDHPGLGYQGHPASWDLMADVDCLFCSVGCWGSGGNLSLCGFAWRNICQVCFMAKRSKYRRRCVVALRGCPCGSATTLAAARCASWVPCASCGNMDQFLRMCGCFVLSLGAHPR
jgi:hypothetical protein